jgi:hypothetical protein
MKRQGGKMVPNCIPSKKADTPMDVAYNPIATDPTPASPSSSINPSVGMKRPQYMLNFGRQVGGGVHDKRVVDIWTIKSDNEILPTPTYQTPEYDGCDCETCMMLNTNCASCPDCGQDMETQNSELGKRDFNTHQRRAMASSGAAMPDGSFPIANAKDLANAIRLYGRAKNPEAAKAHIKRRAAALGLTANLPDDWKKSDSFFNFRNIKPTRKKYEL